MRAKMTKKEFRYAFNAGYIVGAVILMVSLALSIFLSVGYLATGLITMFSSFVLYYVGFNFFKPENLDD